MTAVSNAQEKTSTLPRAEIVAHRGSSFKAPENTLSAYKLAWEENADAAETDIYLTTDKKIVCYHDKELKRTSGAAGYIYEKSLAELQELEAGAWKSKDFAGEPNPELKTLLATIPEGKRLFVEIKCGVEIVPFLIEEIKGCGKKPEQIAFISFDYDVCAELKKEMPEYKNYFLSGFKKQDDGTFDPTIPDLIRMAKQVNLDGLDVSYKGPITRENVQAIHDAGLTLAVYTVDDPAVAKRLIRAGVDSITTNKPDVMLSEVYGIESN